MPNAPRFALTLALVAIACAGVACEKSTPLASSPHPHGVTMPSAATTAKLARSSNDFAFDLYARVKDAPGNLAMSPASITAALAMTWGGARGETEAQMRTVLHLEGSTDDVMADWGSIAQALQDPSRPMKLRIANRLFGEKTAAFDAQYIEKTRTAYGAPLEQVDFKTAFDPARVKINAWVEQQTEQRIKDLLPVGALDTLTRLVLVNAIYFLADWADPFETTSTMPTPFTMSKGVTKKVPTMHRAGSYRLAKADGVTILELPYKGGDAAMLVMLPDETDGIARLEGGLSAAKLEAWTSKLAPQLALVAVPRFEVNPEGSMSLDAELRGLGMTNAFDREKADFTGISNPADPRDRVSIAKVFHKAFVKVDEKGTEAAAATAVAMMGGAAPQRMTEFRADHPFVFAIVDKLTGLVLFLGRVTDPTMK